MRRITLQPVPLYLPGGTKPVVDDVVALCKAVLKPWVDRLSDEEYEDALGHLLAESVDLVGRYDPSKDEKAGETYAVAAYLRIKLPGRLIDWHRSEKGDSRNKTARPEHVALTDDAVEALIEIDEFVEQIVEAASFASDCAELSDSGLWILEHVGRPVARGESHVVIANRLGVSRRKVARLLEDLRNELLGIAVGTESVVPTTDELIEHLHSLEASNIDHGREQE